MKQAHVNLRLGQTQYKFNLMRKSWLYERYKIVTIAKGQLISKCLLGVIVIKCLWFDLFLEDRAEMFCCCFLLKRWHPKNILKLTDLYPQKLECNTLRRWNFMFESNGVTSSTYAFHLRRVHFDTKQLSCQVVSVAQ